VTLDEQQVPVVGLIITAPGFAAVRELARLLPETVDPVITTARLREVSPEGITEYWQMLDYVLDQVASAEPSYVVQNTVVISLTGEISDIERLRQRIADHTGAQCIVGAQAVVDTLLDDRIRHPLVVAPYVQTLRERMATVLSSNGIEASGWIGPEMRSPGDIHRTGASSAAQLIRHGMAGAGPTCDGVIISGGGWSSLDLIGELETEFSVPVLSSNIAQARQLAKLSGRAILASPHSFETAPTSS
jgi:maleate cis-trans isomerase